MTNQPDLYRLRDKRVWVAGSSGMVGSSLLRQLKNENCQLLTVGRDQVDLRRQSEVEDWMSDHKPEAIFLAAAKVGGIVFNQSYPADFLYDNLMIEANIIHAAQRIGVEKLLFLGSSCIYPRETEQPVREEALMTGALETTNQWYALSKIAGIRLCQSYREQFGCDFISAMPTNLYGENDNFDLQTGHVIPALMAKAHRAKIAGENLLNVWGTGNPRREFLYVDDAVEAMIFLMKSYSGGLHINVGAGVDISIRELSLLIAQVVGFDGALKFETDKPDGTLVKCLDVSRLTEMGWRSRIGLREGLERTYASYLKSLDLEPDSFSSG